VQTRIFNENEGADLWHYLGQSIPILLNASPATAIFKIAQLPSRLGTLLTQLRRIADPAGIDHAVLARGCGVVYFALLRSSDDAEALQLLSKACSSVFQLCTEQKASATLPWCPTALKRVVNIWGPSPGTASPVRPDLGLMRRVKCAFDPQNIFAPSRFVF
jgi:FAD/FMN-containing dehydrogenase